MHRPRAMKVHCTGTHSAQQLAALVHMPCMCCPAYGSGCPHAHDAPGGPLAQRLVLLQHLDRAGLRGDQPRRAVAQLPRLIHTVYTQCCSLDAQRCSLNTQGRNPDTCGCSLDAGRWPHAVRSHSDATSCTSSPVAQARAALCSASCAATATSRSAAARVVASSRRRSMIASASASLSLYLPSLRAASRTSSSNPSRKLPTSTS